MQFVFHLVSGERMCVAQQDVNVVLQLINCVLHNYIRKGEVEKYSLHLVMDRPL